MNGSRPMNLLVIGGSGFLGRALCAELIQRSGGGGGRLTVPSRQPQRAKALAMLPTVDLLAADVHDDAQLARLVAGRDAVVNLVGILHGGEADFQRAHVELPNRIAHACRQAGVRRLVHVSALGAQAGAPSMYLRSKAAGEAVLQQSGLDVMLLRPSVMFGEEDRFMNLFAQLQRVLPVLPLGGADARFQPVWVQDVAAGIAQAVARALAREAPGVRSYDCAGPKVYTLSQLVRLAGRWSGHPRPLIALPDGVARLQAGLMEWLPGTPLMSRDNLDSMKVPNVANEALPGLAALGVRRTGLEAVVPAYLGGVAGPARLEGWRRQAGRR
jgi:NADH dehydrogenase